MLGWVAEQWDLPSCGEPYTDDRYFCELSPAQRKAAISVGLNKTIWDNDEDADVWDKGWKKLTPKEKKAVQSLGWTFKAWSTCD